MRPDHIYLQGDHVDTYPAARRILTEYCEANREKDEAVPMDLDLLQQGKGKDKGKGGKGKYDWYAEGKGKDKGKGKGREQQAKGSKDAGATLRGTAVAVASGATRARTAGKDQRRELRVMEAQESEETEGAVVYSLACLLYTSDAADDTPC
eukprot:6096656-Amphidinium_carterae.1